MPPDEPVEKFRIEYVPAAGGKTEVVSAIDTFDTNIAFHEERYLDNNRIKYKVASQH